ncbi:MFS transporter [Fructilactobacillus lindneri]|uniref:Transport protein n=1 Tax=Fructilactobacillus lindneri DSM 20690 = JCM 11027 TaxID=1122148 RepID=A0A0R2JTQ2_9LACO|nr:MFS transporter [Fructilactobacillus lindneri]KRN80480.1 transport protein [Fructilactobacillus lindneri DSM 20690 = JCM 11027]SKA03390.1 Major Facilitator Superfamily protein [Fructilactobacillus lindneri DSM 20690 = JCM 11027]
MALMILFTQWISLYAHAVLHFRLGQAQFLMSLYSIGSICGVLVLYLLLKHHVHEILLLLGLNLTAFLALLLIFLNHSIIVIGSCAVIFGFCAAGGVMQTGLTLFMQIYPHRRGLITGIFYFFGSIASFTIPIITGWLSKQSIRAAFGFDLVIGLVGIGLVLLVQLAMKTRKEG